MRRSTLLLFLIAAVVAASNVATAQSSYQFRDPNSDTPLPAPAGPDGNWNVDDNWYSADLLLHFIPDFSIEDGEIGRIENGGTAYVDTDLGISPGQIILGSATDTSGGLEIRSGGVLASRQGTATNGAITVGSGGGTGTLTVLPGGTLSAEGTLAQGTGSGNAIVVGGTAVGTATLAVNSAVIPRSVQVYPNADFSTVGGLNFQPTTEFVVESTGNGVNGVIDVGGTATLAGTLNLNFTGYSPTVGHNWTVLEAGTINGNFANVTSNATLAFNQNFVVTKPDLGGDREGLNVSVAEVLVLEVNRNSGTATIKHPGGSAILMDGYFVGSDVGSLDAASRQSVNGQSTLGTGWVDTAATALNVGELRPSGDGTVPGGNVANISLGAIFDPFAGAFGQDNEDLEFSYRRSSDGTKFNGVVQYTGTAFNTLLLQVDPTGSGDAYLRNTSDTAVQIDGYHVLSDSGSLTTAGWNSLDEQNYQGSNTWLEVASNANLIGEFNQSIVTPYLTLNPGASFNLGPLFTGGDEDLEFSFLLAGDEEGTTGKVLYEAFSVVALPGDYNADGRVDAADYTVWRNNLGDQTEADINNNGNGSGGVDAADYTWWKQHYGDVAPGAGTGGLAGGQVPEPATGVLGVFMLSAVALGRRLFPARGAR